MYGVPRAKLHVFLFFFFHLIDTTFVIVNSELHATGNAHRVHSVAPMPSPSRLPPQFDDMVVMGTERPRGSAPLSSLSPLWHVETRRLCRQTLALYCETSQSTDALSRTRCCLSFPRLRPLSRAASLPKRPDYAMMRRRRSRTLSRR